MDKFQHAIPESQARALIAAQMPDLADLPLRRVGASGTDNVIFRLGTGLAARFPRRPRAEAQIAVTARWLPELAGALPVAIPYYRTSNPKFCEVMRATLRRVLDEV